MTQKLCSKCGKAFQCGADSSNACWCASMPAALKTPSPAFDCFCPECLVLHLAAPDASEQPFLVEGEDYYFENGLFVMTALYHIKRGSCCGSRCKNCPFDPKYEPGATNLIMETKH